MEAATLARTLASLALVALPIGAARTTGATAAPSLCVTRCATAIALPGHAEPFGITRGPLKSIWFSCLDAVERIDQDGMITTYHVPTPNATVGWLRLIPVRSGLPNEMAIVLAGSPQPAR